MFLSPRSCLIIFARFFLPLSLIALPCWLCMKGWRWSEAATLNHSKPSLFIHINKKAGINPFQLAFALYFNSCLLSFNYSQPERRFAYQSEDVSTFNCFLIVSSFLWVLVVEGDECQARFNQDIGQRETSQIMEYWAAFPGWLNLKCHFEIFVRKQKKNFFTLNLFIKAKNWSSFGWLHSFVINRSTMLLNLSPSSQKIILRINWFQC